MWLKSIGGAGNEQGLELQTEANGRCHLFGDYAQTMIAGNTRLESSGYSDIFIATINPDGKLLQVRSLSGSSREVSYDIEYNATTKQIGLIGLFNGAMKGPVKNQEIQARGRADFFFHVCEIVADKSTE